MLAIFVAALALSPEQLSAEVTPKFMEGVHFACEASFETIIQDTAYHQGRPVVIAGSFSLYYWPDQSRLFVSMKLGVSPDGTQWRAPANAYVVNGYQTNLSEQQAQSEADSPGFRLFVYDPGGEETLNAIGRLGGEGTLNVAYTFEGGSMGMTFPVQLTDQQAAAWSECIEELVRRDG